MLRNRRVWAHLSPALVRGQNVSQALQFVASGNADFGLVPLSLAQSRAGSMWIVPDDLHQPIVQQAVLLTDREAAAGFVDFVRSEPARNLIRSSGYKVP